MKNSLIQIFYILLLLERYHHNYQVTLAATGMNVLISSWNPYIIIIIIIIDI